jgi:Putative MetA-pathway of phenol degradation
MHRTKPTLTNPKDSLAYLLSLILNTGQGERVRNPTMPPMAWLSAMVISITVLPAAPCASVEPDSDSPPDPMSEPLVTDRPDFTESTETIPPGHFQLEAGYTFTYDREGEDRVRDHTAPELLMRVGVVENFEIRIGWSGYSWTDIQFQGETRGGRKVTRGDRTQGGNDLSLGFKYKVIEQDGLIPHFGVIGAITVPSGSPAVSSRDVDPEVVLLWAYDVTDGFSIAGNVGLAVPNEDGDRFFQTSASLSAAFALSERLGAYVEYFGFYPNTQRSDSAHSLNGGFTYLVNNNFQLDWRVGIGLNEEADDFFAGVGFVWRY